VTIPIRALLVAVLLAAASAQGAIEARRFSSPENEARYRHLIEELRCLVCQNQNLEDSNAELARDLRRQVHDMIESGASDQEILRYMVDRYGDFVLYRPPLKGTTWLLWFGPLLLAVIAGGVLLLLWRRRDREPAPELSAEERRRVRALLDGDRPGDGA